MHEFTFTFLLLQPIGLFIVFGVSWFAFRRLKRSLLVALFSSGLTALYIFALWVVPVELRDFGHSFMTGRSHRTLEPEWVVTALDVFPVCNIILPVVVFLAVGAWHRRSHVHTTPPEE